jgi:hypothetical protein
LIKLMAILSLVFASLFVRIHPIWWAVWKKLFNLLKMTDIN